MSDNKSFLLISGGAMGICIIGGIIRGLVEDSRVGALGDFLDVMLSIRDGAIKGAGVGVVVILILAVLLFTSSSGYEHYPEDGSYWENIAR
jgi:hypothetical protein